VSGPPTLALDIGGSTTRIGAFPAPEVSPDCVEIARFLTAADYDEELARIASVLAQAPVHAGIGVSFGGRITRDGRRVAVAPNLPAYEGRPLAHDLMTRCGGPVRLAHDPVCGLLAERRHGALSASERCAYLTVSTGTGAALQLGKEGSDGAIALTISIEFAHQIVLGNTRECLCGQVGCLETYTGGKQLEQRHGRPLDELEDERVWAELVEMLAIGLVNLAHLTRVEHVALSGAIALHRPGLIDAAQAEVDRRIRGAALRLERARLGEQAPLVGAALLLTTPARRVLH
jgi:glucokinase